MQRHWSALRHCRKDRGARIRTVVAAIACAIACAGCGAPNDRPHILLVTLDTTRADHLGFHGYPRDTSPNLDALAEASIVYERAVSTSSWTLPAHASLFTGKFTASHGAHYDPDGPLALLDAIDGNPQWEKYRARGIARGETTLASVLASAGYRTGAVVAGPWMKAAFGLDAGFATYDDDDIHSLTGRLAAGVTDRALAWLDEPGEPDQRFFLFLNYYDPHTPYWAPGAFRGRFLPDGTDPAELARRDPTLSEYRDLYDAEIFYMDFHLGRLLDALRARGLFEDTWIIVTADHGELFGEHGLVGHGKFLFQPELHIPMVVKAPGASSRGVRRADRIQQVDVLPMIAARLGLPLPAGIQGQAPPGIDHPIIAETYPLPSISKMGHWRALIDGDMKYAWNSVGTHLLFDLRADPGEERNLLLEKSELARELEVRLEQYLAGLPAPGPAEARELDAETRKALEELGYLE